MKQKQFKFKGSAEDVAKVVAMLEADGYTNIDDDEFCDEYFLCANNDDEYGKRYQYAMLFQYDTQPLLPLCAIDEMEILGKTDKSFITSRATPQEHPWIENTGKFPNISDDVKIEIEFRDGQIRTDNLANEWEWGVGESPADILRWRLHKPSDAEYFKQPETFESLFGGIPPEKIERRKIKSNGGPTDYYVLTIKTKDGKFKCQVGDVIRAMVGNDFDLGNVLKATRRIWCEAQGYGKEGIDMSYDVKKIKYFTNEFYEANK